MAEQVDAVVIGMGPGGEDIAGALAEAGLSVVGVENNLVGGECPYWGCIPSKMMIRAADLLAEARRVPGLAGDVSVTPDWSLVARRIREVATDNWDDRVAAERFEKKGGHLVRGTGRLLGPGRVAAGDREFEVARAIVVATGTEAHIPPISGLADVPYWTNRQAIECAELPASLLVLGGGAIGVELAQVFTRFGVRVTIIENTDRPLFVEEPECGEILAEVLTREGVDIRCESETISAAVEGDQVRLTFASGGSVSGEKLLVVTGRRARITDIGLETVGIDTSRRFIDVDDHMRAADGVWAIGDIVGHGLFTHMAMYQAGIAAADILGRESPGADYRSFPRITFTDPEVGAAGMTEKEARARGINVRVATAKISDSTRGWIHGPGNEGLVKLVEDADRGVLVGATTMAARGGEMMSMLALAIQCEIPTARLRHMPYAYPSFYRAIEPAVKDLVPS